MYFKARNGTYKRVPQIPNRGNTGETGGMTVYYTSPYDGSEVTAFKPGFRMLAGDSAQRTDGGITNGMLSASVAIRPRTSEETTRLFALTRQ